jgi:hypothetical protein
MEEFNWNALSVEQKQLVQSYVLGITTDGNPGLVHKSVATQDKDLHTDKKILVQAINELLKTVSNASISVDTFNTRFNNIIGNDGAEEAAEYLALVDIGGNLLKAFASLRKDVSDVKEDVEKISGGDVDVDLTNYYDIDEVDLLLSDITGRLDGIDNSISAINSSISTINSGISTLTEYVNDLREHALLDTDLIKGSPLSLSDLA